MSVSRFASVSVTVTRGALPFRSVFVSVSVFRSASLFQSVPVSASASVLPGFPPFQAAPVSALMFQAALPSAAVYLCPPVFPPSLSASAAARVLVPARVPVLARVPAPALVPVPARVLVPRPFYPLPSSLLRLLHLT